MLMMSTQPLNVEK